MLNLFAIDIVNKHTNELQSLIKNNSETKQMINAQTIYYIKERIQQQKLSSYDQVKKIY